MKLFYITPLLLFSFSLFGQKALKKADKYYSDYQFNEAISFYLEAFSEKDIDSFYIKTRLAESYRKTSEIEQAAHWYKQTLFQTQTKSVYYLYYGIMLQGLGECDSANVYLDIYKKLNPDKLHSPHRRCKDKSERIPKIEKRYYKVNPLPFNTEDNEVKVTFFKDNLLLTRSEIERPKTNIRDGYGWYAGSLNEIFLVNVATINAANYQYTFDRVPKEFHPKVNMRYKDIASFYHEDSSWFFITRDNVFPPSKKREKPVYRYKTFHGKIDQANQLNNVFGLPINSDEYSVMHPFLAADGVTLYFASDMPGSFGGFDIYKSVWEDGMWSPPMNLGPTVNTAYDEKSPYLLESKNRLYFSSNRPESFGGFDIFYFNYKEDAYYNLTQLPKPLNSKSNEIDFIINDEGMFGYIASDRVGGRGGYDVYSFTDISLQIDIFVFDRLTNQPFPNTKVYCNLTKDTLVTGENGRVTHYLPIENEAYYEVSADSFLTNKLQVHTIGYTPNSKMFVKIGLLPIMDFNLSGRVIDEKYREPIEGIILTLTNDCDEVERTDTTGQDGLYSFDSLNMDCCYRVIAQPTNNFLRGTSHSRICTRGQRVSKDFSEDIRLFKLWNSKYIPPSQRIDIVYYGTVILENGQPFANEKLKLQSTCNNKSIITTTNDKGEYAFRLRRKSCCYELQLNNQDNYFLELSDLPILICPAADDIGEPTQIHRDIKVYKR